MAENHKPEEENNQNAVSRITTRLLASFSGTSSSDIPIKPLKPGINCWHCFLKTGRDSETTSEGDFDSNAGDLDVVISEKTGLVSNDFLVENCKLADQKQTGSESSRRGDLKDVGLSASGKIANGVASLHLNGEVSSSSGKYALPKNPNETDISPIDMDNLNEMARLNLTSDERQQHEPRTNILPDIFQSADHERPLPVSYVTPCPCCGVEGDLGTVERGELNNQQKRHCQHGKMNHSDQGEEAKTNGSCNRDKEEENVDTFRLNVEENAAIPDLNGSEILSVETRSQSESEVFSEMSTGTTDTEDYSTTNESDLDIDRLSFGEANLNLDIPAQYKEYQGYADWNKFFQSIHVQQGRDTEERESTPVRDDNSDYGSEASGIQKCSVCHRDIPMPSSEVGSAGSELSSPDFDLAENHLIPLKVLSGHENPVCNGCCSDSPNTNNENAKIGANNSVDFCFKDETCDSTTSDTTPTSGDFEQLGSNIDRVETENMKCHNVESCNADGHCEEDKNGDSNNDISTPFHGGLVKVDELAGSHGQSHGMPKPLLHDTQANGIDLDDTATEDKNKTASSDKETSKTKTSSGLIPFVPKLEIPDSSQLFEDREFNFVKADFRRSVSLKTNKTPPGTPHRKKEVRFADALGLDLESVRHIFNLEQPPMIPSSAIKGLSSGQDSPTTRITQGSRHLSECFRQPACEPDFHRRVSEGKVCLENTMVTDMTITGTIRVANIAFHKNVFVHYSTDNWANVQDIPASYVANSCDGPTDRFAFTISLPRDFTVGSRLKFAVCYNAGGQVYWDNNNGEDYMYECYFRALPSSESDQQWLHFL